MPDTNDSQEKQPTAGETPQMILNRLRSLVDSARFRSEGDRDAFATLLDELSGQLELGDNDVPQSMHESLLYVEQSTIARLHDSDENPADLHFSWKDAKRSFDEALLRIEAKHPKLAAALTRLEQVLSSTGV